MKFLRVIVVTAILSLLAIMALQYAYWSRYRNVPYPVEPEWHIVAFGNSLNMFALNDSILDDWRNLAFHGMTYAQCNAYMKRVLESNDHIDTVVLNAGLFHYVLYCDSLSKRPPQLGVESIEYIFANMDYADYLPYLTEGGYWRYLLKKDMISLLKKRDGPVLDLSHSDISECLLDCNSEPWTIEWYNQRKKYEPKQITFNYIKNECKQNDKYLRKMIQLCHDHNAVLVLLGTPLYQYDRWYDNNGLMDYYATLPDTLLIADYQNFEFPDSTYFYDVHHLNRQGAEYFSTYIKEHGLRTQRLGDYVKEYRLKHKK